jgi:hypothetical protein
MRPPTDFSQPVSTKADAAPEWSLAWPGLYVSTIDPDRHHWPQEVCISA